MFGKKAVYALCSCLVTISLVACGTSETTSNKTLENEVSLPVEVSDKGTRNNPYEIGDIITLDEMSPIYPYGDLKDCTFQISFKVDEAYSPSEGISIVKKKYDTFTAVPAAKVTFTLNGNYDDEITWNEVFKISVLSEEMETYSYMTFDDCEDLSQKITIFTGYEYTYYVLTNHDISTDVTPASKYLILEYADADAETHSLYVSLETNEAGEESSETDNITTEVGESENPTYEAALAAEEKGYYKIAENLYLKAGNYEDAEDRYNEMKEYLAQYNGTYYGDSTQYTNVKVYIYIYDGDVRAQFEGRDISSSNYELYKYGMNADGSDLMAFADSRTGLYELTTDTEYGDGFALGSDGNGGYIIAATEGSSSYSWNGLYEKISDEVDENLFK